MKVTVSAATFYACLEPGTSEFYDRCPAVAHPHWTRQGDADFGEVNGEPLWQLLAHLRAHADIFLDAALDEQTDAEARAIRRDWERLVRGCEPRQHGYYLTGERGYYHDERGWALVRMRVEVPANTWVGTFGTRPMPWLEVADRMSFVSAERPDQTWRTSDDS